MKKIFVEVLDYIKIILIALIITNILNVFVFSLSQVRQSSMDPTLIEKDQLIVEKLTYAFSQPKRGDIVVFIDEMVVDNSISGRFKRLYDDMFAKIKNDEGHLRLVKRVVGLPGDEIEIKDGFVYINGKKLDEPYLSVETSAKSLDYPFVVPDGEYFCLGDNRTVSFDSRDFGPVPVEKIEGKVLIRFWPFSKIGTVN